MDERVGSVMRVLQAMEELDHSELTRGNVKAATRAVESMHTELVKTKGADNPTESFEKLLNMAEKGNWTELRNSRNNGIMPNARHEINGLVSRFDNNPVSPSPAMGKPARNGAKDRGYPPQHSAHSEQEYLRRRQEAELEHRDRRSVASSSWPNSASTTNSENERYQIRRRDDPKQVSNQISQLGAERLRDVGAISLDDVTSPNHVSELFTDLYNREWTSAYEQLNKANRDGSETIQQLLRILENAFKYCQNTAERQMVNMLMYAENEMLYPNISQNSRAALEAQVRPDRRSISLIRESDDMIKQFRKFGATASLPVTKWLFYEEILKTIQPAQRPSTDQVAFIDRCIDVCWLMAVQDKPMHLQFCEKGEPASSLFRPFTRTGNYVQNCVWPALYLHKGGPLLEKGIAHLG